ncbi:N-acetylmuramoyl-L-alanine amidase (plasmid) [Bacillus mycoides]|uniref:N-acetylmuramoyl-L-alanine amidase n=1 Tax=Bacillus mycoides TaxID=1405 RepID=UPI001C035FCC|nr:N-acetylmuramoyl-L-alanine amidase [Bacillus mycoides]QWH04299.1 N-acetylmuramoyl-L-alanine amidase [Bacillus mycoides]
MFLLIPGACSFFRSAFVHYAVDLDKNVQIASTKYRAWGAGPAANARFVHVELCETSDLLKFKRSYERYIELNGEILRERNIHPSKGLWTHKDATYKFGGTDHEDLLDYLKSHGVSEAQFRADVQRAYTNSSVDVSVPEKPSKPAEVPTAITDGIAYIEGYNVNLRKGPDTIYSKTRQLNKPEAYVVWGEKDGWLNLGGEQWIKNNRSYVKLEKKSTVDSSIVGKRFVSKVNNLRFYNAPSWQDKDVAVFVDSGLGFTIDAKVSVDGSTQYKVHNSKGKTYYVTANEAFVYVK